METHNYIRPTLYEKILRTENMHVELRGKGMNISEAQRELFQRYEDNPVLYDAIKGKQTIEESLEDLAKVNKGYRKFLPRKKDKEHNEGIEHMGELITEPSQLEKAGITEVDNPVTGIAEGAIMGMVASGALYGISSVGAPELSIFDEFMLFGSSFGGLVGGAISSITTPERFSELPYDEAKYLDEKVKDFY